MELNLPNIGALVPVRDLESGRIAWLDLGSRRQRRAYSARIDERRDSRERLFKRLKLDVVDLHTDQSYIDPLAKFFKLRARRH